MPSGPTSASGRDIGASVAVYHRGVPVIDLVGGWFDEARTRPYGHDTLQLVFSTTKGLTAMAAAVCVERGWLDYDGVVAEYWPEFAATGKEEVTVAQLLSHQAGLAAIDGAVRLEEILDWDHMADTSREAGAVVGARLGPRVPRRHLRLAGRRARPPGGSAAAQPRCLRGRRGGRVCRRRGLHRPARAPRRIGCRRWCSRRCWPTRASAAAGPPDARPRHPSRAGPHAQRGRSLRRSRLEHPSGARRADPGRQRHQHGVVAGPRLRRLRRRGRRPATARPGHDRQSERDDHAGRGARPGPRGADDVRHGFHDLGPVHADAGAGILRTRGGRRLAGLRRTPRPRSASPTP